MAETDLEAFLHGYALGRQTAVCHWSPPVELLVPHAAHRLVVRAEEGKRELFCYCNGNNADPVMLRRDVFPLGGPS